MAAPMSTDHLKLLFVQRDLRRLVRARREFGRRGWELSHRTATNPEQLDLELEGFRPDAVICEVGVPGLSGLHALNAVLRTTPATPVVMISQTGAEQAEEIEPLRRGGADFLKKCTARQLATTVLRAVSLARKRRDLGQSTSYDARISPPTLSRLREHITKPSTKIDWEKASKVSLDRLMQGGADRRMECALRAAVRDGGLSLRFQPQFEISTRRCCGVEALARWYRDDGQMIEPSTFIPLAERTDLICDLGKWALMEACQAAATWLGLSEQAPTVCVNVSARQITHEFTSVIAEALEASKLPSRRLELEITESVLLENSASVLACLESWKRLGVAIAIDDFGAGYSSLSYLASLPVDRVKIDKSLIARIVTEPKTKTVVRAVVSLGRDLGFTVIGEGVERRDQLDALSDCGCNQVQGFLMAPAAQASELPNYLRRRRQLGPLQRQLRFGLASRVAG